jgi:hypothetical protein
MRRSTQLRLVSSRSGLGWSQAPVFLFGLGLWLILAWHRMAAAEGAPTGGERKNILVLYGERSDLPAVQRIEQTFQKRFGEASSPSANLFSEYFDFARFPAAENDASLTRYLRERYAGRKSTSFYP